MPPVLLRAPGLSALPWLRHGFGTRACGLAAPGSEPWRERGARSRGLRMLRQIHSDLVWHDPEAGRAGDGLMTDRPGGWLGIRTADCCPVLLADCRQRAVAAVHAGWRGTLARISEKAIGEMRAAFGTR